MPLSEIIFLFMGALNLRRKEMIWTQYSDHGRIELWPSINQYHPIFFFIYLFFILTLQKIHDFISHVYHYDIFFWIDLFYFAKTFFFWLKNTTKNSGNRVYRLNLFDLVAIPAWSWRNFHVFWTLININIKYTQWVLNNNDKNYFLLLKVEKT